MSENLEMDYSTSFLANTFQDSEFNLQAVVGGADMGQLSGVEFGGEGAVVEVVAEVGEVGSAGAEVSDDFEALVEREMGGVGAVAQRVEDEDADAADDGAALLGQLVEVGHVGEGAAGEVEAEALGVRPAVDDGEGRDAERFAALAGGGDGEGRVGGAEVELGAVGAGDVGLEDVVEDAADVAEGGGAGVERDGLAALDGVDAADVVKAEEVVDVGVGDEGGVDAPDVGAEGLLAEVGRGVDEDAEVAG